MTPPKDTTPNPSQDELREQVLAQLKHAYFSGRTDRIAQDNGVTENSRHALPILENKADDLSSLIDAHTEEKVREAETSDYATFKWLLEDALKPEADTRKLSRIHLVKELVDRGYEALTNKGKDTTQTMPSLDNQEVRGDK